MAGRMYTVPLTNPAGTAGSPYSAATDFWEVVNASTKVLVLHEVVLGQTSDYGDAQAEGLPFFIKRGVGHTPGTGGAAVTPAKHQTGDAAAAATAKILNTTQATGGTITLLRAEPFNVQAGEGYLPTPEERYTFAPSESIIVSGIAPADALAMVGSLTFEEIG